MGSAWVLATVSLFGRVDSAYTAATPAPWWTVAASDGALLVMIASAWFGGELVYGHAIGVSGQENKTARDA